MAKTDMSLARPADIRIALMLLSRLPLPPAQATGQAPEQTTGRFAQAAWAYPIVGLILGGLAALAGALLLTLGLPPSLSAIGIIATLTLATGAMHEDGLADTADGFWGGWDIPRRLEIMKDSQIGSYGVMALIMAFASRWAAITALLSHQNWWAALIMACILSRAAMPIMMHSLPHARNNGLSHHTGRPKRATVALGLGVGLALTAALLGPVALPLILVLGAILLCVSALMAWLSLGKIGGQTGDTLGATQVTCEIALLTFLCA